MIGVSLQDFLGFKLLRRIMVSKNPDVDGLRALEKMVYPGRGLIVGMSLVHEPILVYFITGRSEESQSRKLAQKNYLGTIRTEVTDLKQLKKGVNPLLVYPAIMLHKEAVVASNGLQTSLLYTELTSRYDILENYFNPAVDVLSKALKKKVEIYDSLNDRMVDITSFEPDSPIFTPRINACVFKDSAAMSIICRGKDFRSREKVYRIALKPGYGKLLTTYAGDGKEPLKPFEGKPLDVGLGDNFGLLHRVYEAINGRNFGRKENYAVAVAAVTLNKMICLYRPEVFIHNRFDDRKREK